MEKQNDEKWNYPKTDRSSQNVETFHETSLPQCRSSQNVQTLHTTSLQHQTKILNNQFY